MNPSQPTAPEEQGGPALRGVSAAAEASSPHPPPEVPDYELVSCIGRGSYGDVWLARSVIGGWRAVKVVYRREFKQERPYAREFDGIRKFEPVSRRHPSQLCVHHVGRNETGGYFYYVMELADDAGPAGADSLPPSAEQRVSSHPPASSSLNPRTYVPRTLKLELNRRGQLPLEECLQIGLALTTALEHLHEHGLVHRDIKPSNIIFVNRTAKLADIGLVTSLDATISFVGTTGFLPPEGPGTAQGDIYSLGKVLYEMAMGRDRQEFPKLPADLAQYADPSRLLELNAVILKACHSDPRQRYDSAKELAADLLLLQRGQSIRRLRAVERRLAFATKAGGVIAALLAVAAGLYWNAVREAKANARQLYVADMTHAFQAWDEGNVVLAREVLEIHRRRQPEMLGFEWRLIARLCQESDARRTWRGHTGVVWCVAISPDGQTLATGGSDRSVRLWDATSGSPIRTLEGHAGWAHALAFSPDGALLASGGRDFKVRLWDLHANTRRADLIGHTDAVRAVAFSPDRQYLVSSGEDKTVRWWNLTTAQEVACCPVGFSIERLAFSPDERILAACGLNERVCFWDGATRQRTPVVVPHPAMVPDLDYSSDGRVLATGCADGRIRIWDTATTEERSSFGRGAPVRCLRFLPGDQLLAVVTQDGLIRLWDTDTQEVRTTLRGHTVDVRALASSPQGGLLASGDVAGVVKVWDWLAESRRASGLRHTGMVNGLAFSPNSRLLATTDRLGNMLRLWSTESQQEVAAARATNGAVWSVAFAPDGKALATGGEDGTVRLWNPQPLSTRTPLFSHPEPVDAIAFSPDGAFLASGSHDRTFRVWDRAAGRAVPRLPAARGVVRAVAFSPLGESLLTGSSDGELRLWDTGSFTRSRELTGQERELAGYQDIVHAVAFSPDGQTVVAGGVDRRIYVWNARGGKIVGTLTGHAAMISSLAFSPDGRTLASGSWDTTVRLWSVRFLREVVKLTAHSAQVNQVGFSPDGNLLASASSDGTVRLWRAVPNVADGTPVWPFWGRHGNTVR